MTNHVKFIGEERVMITSVLCLLSFVLLAPRAETAPAQSAITDVSAHQRYPWNGKVDISFTATDVESDAHAAGFIPTLKVTAVDRTTTPWTTNVAAAAALSGDMSLADGTHAFVWDLCAQGLSFKSSDVAFRVTSETNEYLVVDLSAGPGATRYPVESFDEAPEDGWNQAVYKTSKLVLRRIAAGSVVTNTDAQAKLTVDKPYYCGIFPVTGIQYTNVVASTEDPSSKKGFGMAPVETVSWDTIMGTGGFISNLVVKAGVCFDLPTEEQWEYACRAGTSTLYNYGDTADDDFMWYNGNAKSKKYEVGTASGEVSSGGNAWGLYDMHGNVYEWTLTVYGEQGKRMIRGGAWNKMATLCASSAQAYESSSTVNSSIGFRLVRNVP